MTNVSDADVGLLADPKAQMQAEFEIRAAIARRLREEEQIAALMQTVRTVELREPAAVAERM